MNRRRLAWKGGFNGLDSKLYLFILLDSRQLEAAVGSNKLFISCHVLGGVDAVLRFIHAVGLLKLAVLVPVHACTQQIIMVFVCGTYVPTLAYLWYLVVDDTQNLTEVHFLFPLLYSRQIIIVCDRCI